MARTVTFGEIMMRLATPGHQRLTQANQFEVSYAGGEANAAVSLAAFGHESSYVTVLPAGPLGTAATAWLRYWGVDTSRVIQCDSGRLGIYFLESGASQRASQVIYDRAQSSVAMAPADTYDWQRLLADCQWFHTTGITPALSSECATATLDALRAARQAGAKTSFDLNYRSKLWSPQEAQATVIPLLEYVDLVIGNEQDARDVLGIAAAKTDVTHGEIDRDAYEVVAREIRSRHGCAQVAITLRESQSASINHWSACLLDGEDFRLSRRYEIHVVDRVGAGDSFCGGLISSLLDEMPPGDALEFAVAASCLKHSIEGDFNKVTREEVLRLCGGDASGRVIR